MKSRKIVIALGGNALGDTPQSQLAAVQKAAGCIADLAIKGHRIVVAHGNGPQVGMINLAMDYSAANGPHIPSIPLAECGAMSQGYIGYHLQQALYDVFRERNFRREIASIVTQVLVREDDAAFRKPVKPIGKFYTWEEALRIASEKGFQFMEDSGRGFRRVVASPRPQKILELNVIRRMMEDDVVVIAAGGGGIPVVERDGRLQGVDAVVDKDLSSAKLAEDLEADMLMILTAVDRVCVNFNRPNQRALDRITVQEAIGHMRDGQFAPGSMLPKVEACVEFVKNNPKGEAVITSLDQAPKAILGEAGTRIVSDRSEETKIKKLRSVDHVISNA
jgi:carbamate kinase